MVIENPYKTLYENQSKLKELYFKQSFDTVSLITYCVDKSTIRAFHSSKGYVKTYKPLSIFRVWAFNFLTDKKNIDLLKSKENFKKTRGRVLKNLENYWISIDGGEPEFYQFNKLIDLFFKCLPLWINLDIKTKNWIFDYTNVPLDKFSLNLLRRMNSKINIPKNVSMNFIDIKNYEKLQKEIKDKCRDIPAIVFDLYAWDESHRPKESFELIKLEKKKK